MILKRLKLIRFLPLVLAAGILVGLPRAPFLVDFEHLAFPAPERYQPETYFLDAGTAADFQLQVLRFIPRETRPSNLGTYRFDEETLEIIGSNGGDPVEWAQFLRQTRLPDDRLMAVTSSLSWPDATELALLALQKQVAQTPRLVVGLRAELLNRPSPLPPELEDSVIPATLPEGFSLPEVDHLNRPPSIKVPLFGISEVRGLKIEKENGKIRVPTMIRWGSHLLPSLPLSCLLTAHDLKPADVLIDPDGYLRLGQSGPILRIDSSAFTWLDNSPVDLQSASQLQIYPAQAETLKIIHPGEPPLQVGQLASQLDQGLSQEPQRVKTYRRWPLEVEIALLVFLALIFWTRRFWLSLLILLLVPGLSLAFSHWFLLTPVLTFVVLHLVCGRGSRGSRARDRRAVR